MVNALDRVFVAGIASLFVAPFASSGTGSFVRARVGPAHVAPEA